MFKLFHAPDPNVSVTDISCYVTQQTPEYSMSNKK